MSEGAKARQRTRVRQHSPHSLVFTTIFLLTTMGAWLVGTIFASSLGSHSARSITVLCEAGTLVTWVSGEKGCQLPSYYKSDNSM